jgi:hypothetical protein
MSTVQTEKFIRKVRPVEAVKVTEDNLSAVAGWCGGLVVPANTIGNDKATYIHVPVRSPRRETDSKAYIGYWIVKEDFRNCRVVTNKQFRNSYDALEKAKAPAPKPTVMPKKKVAETTPGEPTQVGAVEVVPGAPADEGSSLTTGTKDTQEVHRSAESGQFVTEEYADANPSTTVEETIEVNDEAEAEAYANQEEDKVQDNEMSSAVTPESGDVVADELAEGIVPGDMVDPEQPEEDEDGTVQLGAPLDTPGLCGQCGSEVVSGVCSKDIEHDVFGQASTEEQATAPRILPGD